jgi:hypothetical protein
MPRRPGRYGEPRVLHHQSFVAALACREELAVELRDELVPGRLDHGLTRQP